ncbi:hypothetical protein BZG36_02563 [Bifiguratus adelaidae]|uniref:Enoyl reductase (ER) domain-containing protein n=1 Tax=Bifiguratus adelaidae TaxID=1938954 RepID=A0A261Y2F0_9FUNG|nr:hypothetical protein BZG36_02563 [Bifiguratus adelaidae]
MPSNEAAWLVAEKVKPLEVKPATYTPPGEHEIVIKNAAVAINPADWLLQELAPFPLNYPTILGHDVAGEVVEVGSSVTRFRVGDRVLGKAVGFTTHRDCDNAFQLYTVVLDNLASPIPSTMSFEAAAVIPLGLSTAACGMYQKNYLALQYPSVSPKPTDQVLLVWGGSSSVGSNGIQLGVSSGYEVITTASPRNFDYVKKIGASQVFDYNSKTIIEELVDALKGKTIAGVLDCIAANEAIEVCAEVLRKSQGNKFISTVIKASEDLPGGVKTKWIYGGDLKDNEVGKIVYEDYLPKALAEGKFVPAPDPVVVGKGLHAIQDGLDTLKKGASAKKYVITL